MPHRSFYDTFLIGQHNTVLLLFGCSLILFCHYFLFHKNSFIIYTIINYVFHIYFFWMKYCRNFPTYLFFPVYCFLPVYSFFWFLFISFQCSQENLLHKRKCPQWGAKLIVDILRIILTFNLGDYFNYNTILL